MKNKPSSTLAKANDNAGLLLWKTTITWQRLIKKALEPHKISHAQFLIMSILSCLEEEGCDTNQSIIANWTKLDKMTVSKSLKNLVESSFIKRKEHKIDTRIKTISLTNKGQKLIQKLVPIIEKIDADFFDRTSKKEQKSLIEILEKLVLDNAE